MYRVLRNNKEQGPYSLEELVQHSLRPFDLIWVEGKSACWRYPPEIDELKPFLGSASDSILQTSFKPVQPAIQEQQKELQPYNAAEEQEELTEAMLEQKANALYLRVQAYNAKREQEEKDIQTKYARSLEDLKQDYADWLHGKKYKKREISSNNKGWVAFGAVSAAFLIFLLAGKDKEMAWPINTHKEVGGNNMAKQKKISQEESLPVNSSVITNQLSESYRVSVESFIDSMRNVLNKQSLNKPEAVPGKHTKTKVPENQVATHPVQLIIHPVEEEIKAPSIKAANLDARYIPVENSSRIKEVQVTVHNTGTVPLKQVTVDVFYYKKGERFINKETLFFNDIGPGNAFTVSKPGNKKAVLARFVLGELTADN